MYKNVWSPYKRQALIAQPDNRDEAQENNNYAVGIYKKNNDGSEELVGHVLVEFSSYCIIFFKQRLKIVSTLK